MRLIFPFPASTLYSLLNGENDKVEDVPTALHIPRLIVFGGIVYLPSNLVVDNISAESCGVPSVDRLITVSLTKDDEVTPLQDAFEDSDTCLEAALAWCSDEEDCHFTAIRCDQEDDEISFEDI